MSDSKSKQLKISGSDVNQIAAQIVAATTGVSPPADLVEQERRKIAAERAAQAILDGKNPSAVALGRLGGLRGGNARAAALTPEQRSAIAKKAVETRWKRESERKRSLEPTDPKTGKPKPVDIGATVEKIKAHFGQKSKKQPAKGVGANLNDGTI